jgi:carboxymethylenebutenolidase
MELPCKDCVSGYILPGDPRGTFSEGAYHTKAEQGNDANSKKRALVLLTDIFGFELNNPKILADSFANRLGCDVFVPDLFNGKIFHWQVKLRSLTWCVASGHPPVSEHDLAPYILDIPGKRLGLLGTLRWLMVIIRALPSILVNRPSVGLDRAIQVRTSSWNEVDIHTL